MPFVISTLRPAHGLRNFFKTHSAFAALVLVIAATLTGCGSSQEPVTVEPTINRHFNVSFGALPQGFEVVDNTTEVLRLRPTEATEAVEEMWLEVSEVSDYGILIEDIVSSQRSLFEAMPNGSFGGNQKLQTPAGPAFYSRGRYEHGSIPVEETRVFQVHPSENRLITFHYRYPAGEDSADRIGQLFVWLGELSPASLPREATEEPSD